MSSLAAETPAKATLSSELNEESAHSDIKRLGIMIAKKKQQKRFKSAAKIVTLPVMLYVTTFFFS